MILELGAGFYGSIERVLLYIVCCCCRFVRYTLRSTGTYSVYLYSVQYIHELLHAIPPNCIQLNEPPPEHASTYPRYPHHADQIARPADQAECLSYRYFVTMLYKHVLEQRGVQNTGSSL